MLKDCLKVFNAEKLKDSNLVLAKYKPDEGTYIIVPVAGDGSFGQIEEFIIKDDKKTGNQEKTIHPRYLDVRFCDYHSKLLNMNKAMDKRKIIHSNNYLTFFVKKESFGNGKLFKEGIEEFFDVLENPYLKYASGKSKKAYEETEKELGKVDADIVQRNRQWILDHIFDLGEKYAGKGYLKIFFLPEEKSVPGYNPEDYQREGKRYLFPNIFNSNDHNQVVKEKLIGLSNDNMGLNSKKPYLEYKNRRTSAPYIIDQEEAFLQHEFFDYLQSLASDGKNYVYIDLNEQTISALDRQMFYEEDFSGIFLRIKKGMEAEIQDMDVISAYSPGLSKPFVYENMLEIPDVILERAAGAKNPLEYKGYFTLMEMQALLDAVWFSGFLRYNYFSNPKDVRVNDRNAHLKQQLISTRERLFNWFYKGNETGLNNMLLHTAWIMTKGGIEDGNYIRTMHRLNLLWSLRRYYEGGESMADKIMEIKEGLRKKLEAKEERDSYIDNEKEYYFAVGQLWSYLYSQSKKYKPNLAAMNDLLNGKSKEFIRKRLMQMYKKYNYAISIFDIRFKTFYNMILGFQPVGIPDEEMICAGVFSSNLLFEKRASKKEENQQQELESKENS